MNDIDQRREDRTDVSWIAVIRASDGSEIPCTVKDISKSGMKLAVSAEQALPETFVIKIVGRELVFRVRQTWRRQHLLGVSIQTMAKLPPKEEPVELRAQALPEDSHHSLGSFKRYRHSC